MTRLELIQSDHDLMVELRERLKYGTAFTLANGLQAKSKEIERFIEGTFVESSDTRFSSSAMEAVILDFLRPCLLIRNNRFEVPASDVWRVRLETSRQILEKSIPSIGRIEFKYHPRFKWGGTGWLIAQNTIITNRHVASEFARKDSNSIVFMRNGVGVPIEAYIDFQEEYESGGLPLEVAIEQVRFLADEGYPDIALLKLAPNKYGLDPIPISSQPVKSKMEIVVIGYPAYDPVRNPLKPEDVKRIFNNIFEYKRLSPGLILNEEVGPHIFSHDATTLGGNSGSAILDLKSGQAVGLHFSGEFHEANFAVDAVAILDATAKTSVMIPPILNVKTIPNPIDSEDLITDFSQEGPGRNYEDRLGYIGDFLGSNTEIPLPDVEDIHNVLTFGYDNESVLRYLHFSVVMNRSRRLCFFSAVNVNGVYSKRTIRPGWRLDPRIDAKFQIIKECYGNPPKFSRGHMTRREDPAWGETLEIATLGNADSMHVTNSVPQIQPFNAGIWLGLEEYALQNAKKDEMKISVFTGPFFNESDPVRSDVQIPVEFWKIISFIHEATGKLCATGYIMSQESFLTREEFIFGEYKTYQTSIRSIERKAKISFHGLAEQDPYIGYEVLPSPLLDFTQIIFI